jgi:hypothetical protein
VCLWIRRRGRRRYRKCSGAVPGAETNEDVTPCFRSFCRPSYSPTTPAARGFGDSPVTRLAGRPANRKLLHCHTRRARVRGLPSNSSYGGCTAENAEDADGTAPRRFLAGVAAVYDRRCLSLEWFRRSQTAATSRAWHPGYSRHTPAPRGFRDDGPWLQLNQIRSKGVRCPFGVCGRCLLASWHITAAWKCLRIISCVLRNPNVPVGTARA